MDKYITLTADVILNPDINKDSQFRVPEKFFPSLWLNGENFLSTVTFVDNQNNSLKILDLKKTYKINIVTPLRKELQNLEIGVELELRAGTRTIAKGNLTHIKK